MKVSNLEMRQHAGIASTISQQVRRRRWKFIGHVLRSDDEHTKARWHCNGHLREGATRGGLEENSRKGEEGAGFLLVE